MREDRNGLTQHNMNAHVQEEENSEYINFIFKIFVSSEHRKNAHQKYSKILMK